jgi:hypothetical protein
MWKTPGRRKASSMPECSGEPDAFRRRDERNDDDDGDAGEAGSTYP